MAATEVALEVVWFSALSYAVDKSRTMLRPKVQRVMERITGAVMVGLGIRRYESEFGSHLTAPDSLPSAGRAAQRESWGW